MLKPFPILPATLATLFLLCGAIAIDARVRAAAADKDDAVVISMKNKKFDSTKVTIKVGPDAAKDVITTPFSFASDISDLARPVAVDGSLELVGRRDHREAIFWMVATYSRCQAVFAHDAPALYERFDVGYRELLADLGITSASDLHRCRAKLIDFLPRLWREAELIMTANPAIAD